MQRFCWRERSEKLNWRLLGALDVADVVRRGDPALLEPYALHVTFARLPNAPKDPATRDAWFLVRVLQLAMEYLLFMRARDGDVLESLGQELRHVETERDELLLRAQKLKVRARSGDKQVDKLHQVLQNIAKLLQIHGASPSAVATIETLLTELISERRAKQRRRVLVEKENDEDNEMEGVLRPAVQEARVCGFCGKLFSSKEYLEKHLVRRHSGESIEVDTPVKSKMRRNVGEVLEDAAENVTKEDQATSEAVMQKMVQQVERALHEHEEKLRSLAEEEAQKVKQMYERLRTDTKLAEELKATRMVAEQQHEESRRQLDEVCLQKQKAEDELADLKQQIQFHILKMKMMGTAGLPTSVVPHGNDDKLAAAEADIKHLQQTLEDVNSELNAAREELRKVQALHLSALRKKKELADKLALTREPSPVVTKGDGSQTEGLPMINETVQTDEQISPLLIEKETEAIPQPNSPICEDVGTDPVTLTYEDAASQTVDVLRATSADAEVQVAIIDDPVPMLAPAVSLADADPILHAVPTVDSGVGTDVEDVALSKSAQQDDERIPDYIQQLHSQDLLDALTERAQKAANNAASNDGTSDSVSKNCSSISRHKYVRSRFQHDENAVKERVASCLSQLERFASRFGVPAKSAWLSEENLQIVQQALHGHLEILPNEVLARMIECENNANVIIEKEWVPMEKTRQQALDRFKMEARAKSEISQGLVRQAMAAFGTSMKSAQMSRGASNAVVTIHAERAVASEENAAESNLDAATKPLELPTNREGGHDLSVLTPARRYSVKHQLTVVVKETGATKNNAYYSDDFVAEEEKVSLPQAQEAVDDVVDSVHCDTKDLDTRENSMEMAPEPSDDVSMQPRNDIKIAEELPMEEPPFVDRSASSGDVDRSEITEAKPNETSTNEIRSINVGVHVDDKEISFWENGSLARSDSDELYVPEPSPIEVLPVVAAQEDKVDSHRPEWQGEHREERYHRQLPRVRSSSDLEPTHACISAHPALSRSRSGQFEVPILHQTTNSLESDLSTASEFAIIDPTRIDHTQSIVASSEMSFGMDIPSLGESESVEESTSAVMMGLIDALDKQDEAKSIEDSASQPDRAPAPAATDAVVQNDTCNVMSFDDSDIEEVVLT
ncbi:hypothetical protein PF004_g6794 [Phytophthora fragariae]|uniref:C2H2-type domain-containing protein n=1 Tax=Phytophthora fragariae TaxID=53985 RepID=A0A6G0PC00_9STRA|nr:hypothetical protein PF004_g6794 [Phytophthora fragariae]